MSMACPRGSRYCPRHYGGFYNVIIFSALLASLVLISMAPSI